MVQGTDIECTCGVLRKIGREPEPQPCVAVCTAPALGPAPTQDSPVPVPPYDPTYVPTHQSLPLLPSRDPSDFAWAEFPFLAIACGPAKRLQRRLRSKRSGPMDALRLMLLRPVLCLSYFDFPRAVSHVLQQRNAPPRSGDTDTPDAR